MNVLSRHSFGLHNVMHRERLDGNDHYRSYFALNPPWLTVYISLKLRPIPRHYLAYRNINITTIHTIRSDQYTSIMQTSLYINSFNT